MSDISRRIGNLSPEKLALLSKLLAEKSRAQTGDQVIPRRTQENHCPLSFAQERLWFTTQVDPDNPVYNIPIALEIEGAINVEELEQSFSEIIRRHEALRTTFTRIEDQPVQVIGEASPFSLEMCDLSELPESERRAEATRLATEAAQQCFDLARGPLLRVRLLRMAEHHYVILFSTHHIVCDEWSMGVLIQEMVTLLKSFSEGKPSPLADPAIQYADFSEWQRKWLQGEEFEQHLSYWKNQLADLPTLVLPADYARSPVQTFRGATKLLRLDDDLRNEIKAVSLKEGTTLFMTLLAAFKVLLYCYSGQRDIAVGTDIANRSRKEMEGLIGFFANQLVLRTNLSGNPSFREFLSRVRAITLDAYAHQDVPFEKVVRAVNPKRDPGRTPLFQVKFVFQNAAFSNLEVPGLSVDGFEFVNTTAKFDLLFTMGEAAQGLIGSLEYSSELFSNNTIDRMLKHFEILLRSIAKQPDITLDALKELLHEVDERDRAIKSEEYEQARSRPRRDARPKPIEIPSSVLNWSNE